MDVSRVALSGAGQPLSALLAELGLELEIPPDTPPDGWRVLSPGEPDGAPLVLGTPARADGSAWHVAQPSTPPGGPSRLSLRSDVVRLRRSVAERRGGLVLRWPAVTRELLDVDALGVDVVNEGSERWLPDGDGFPTIAVLRPASSESAPYFFAFTGSDRAPALDPGEYARVVARIDPSVWQGLEAGPYRVTAFSPPLRLETREALAIELTSETIEAHRPPPSPSAPDDPSLRRLAEERLRIVRAIRAGRDAFPELVDAIRDARDDERALSRIQDILGCAYDEAQAVYNLQLRRARVGYPDVLALEIESLEQELASPGNDDGAAPVQ